MEDISRELEREIAQSKPSPYKKTRRKRVLIVDDFGTMRSGDHLKKFMYFFLVTTFLCLAAALFFFMMYNRLARENNQVRSQLAMLEKKVATLSDEKEILMARLVISGKDPEIGEGSNKAAAPPKKRSGKKDMPQTGLSQKTRDQKTASVSGTPGPDGNTDETDKTKEGAAKTETEKKPLLSAENDLAEKKIAIEKFSVTRSQGQKDLLVRFDIRNVSPEPGEVSGRIFTILKPEDKPQNQWLVVPYSSLDKGIPTQYKNGQYFSISHFKPVKFRIDNPAGLNFFKTAAILVFNDQGALMFKNDINIEEADQS